MITLTFQGFCDDAGHFALDDRELFRSEVAQHFSGEEVVIEVHKKVRQRTNPQLRWLFGVCYSIIAKELGYEPNEKEELHDAVLGVRFGFVEKPSLIDGVPPRHVPAKRTADLDTQAMGEFMEWVCRWAAKEHGIVVPLPDEPVSEVA